MLHVMHRPIAAIIRCRSTTGCFSASVLAHKANRCLSWAGAVVCCIVLCIPTQSTACEAEWSAFVHQPSTQTFKDLRSKIGECRSSSFHPSDREARILEALITAKDTNATKIGFSSVALFDGGNLEDILKALGLLADSDPTELLRNLKAGRIPDRALGTLLCSPPGVADDAEVQALWLQTRIQKLSTVKDQGLSKAKRVARRQLMACVSEVKRHAKD
ncbi:MAG TPA: hypothetical protein VMH36_09750 [Alphaproteobacteria bacterium]|nr:hypothetical protein [Alphaproteobacteria bacterium]